MLAKDTFAVAQVVTIVMLLNYESCGLGWCTQVLLDGIAFCDTIFQPSQ